MNRRTLIAAAAAIPAAMVCRRPVTRAQETTARFQYPIAWPSTLPGDGFLIRHGYACENTWYNPGFWHTGEDWYALQQEETGGAEIQAIAKGDVVFAGSDYPGRVVIVQHDDALFSMYGHLDYALDVAEGDAVEAGQQLGTVLFRTDGAAPSHLHFEIRTFLTTPEVNGENPRYGFACGLNCPPGPGYWPIDAPEHPSALGWRNPTHVIANRLPTSGDWNAVVVAGGTGRLDVWSGPPDDDDRVVADTVTVQAGDRFPLLTSNAGPDDSAATSAEVYQVWYQIEIDRRTRGWVEAVSASDIETGSDGRPSAVTLTMIPAADTD